MIVRTEADLRAHLAQLPPDRVIELAMDMIVSLYGSLDDADRNFVFNAEKDWDSSTYCDLADDVEAAGIEIRTADDGVLGSERTPSEDPRVQLDFDDLVLPSNEYFEGTNPSEFAPFYPPQ